MRVQYLCQFVENIGGCRRKKSWRDLHVHPSAFVFLRDWAPRVNDAVDKRPKDKESREQDLVDAIAGNGTVFRKHV
jgi:hypothetical protein